jgi:crossover junction endodeoxyribonuclease RuvC
MIYVGIDPGQNGGVAFVDEKNAESFVIPMPDIFEFNDLILGWEADFGIKHVYVEKAQAMPKQGVTSMFTYGTHFGTLLGVLTAHKVPYTLVPPKEWQREMFKGTPTKRAEGMNKPKERALQIARRLFPKQNFLKTLRAQKPHDGMIDSILIAEACRRGILR